MSDTAPIVIGYDGSDDARRAVDAAAALFPGAAALVLTVWRPLVATLASYPMSGMAPLPSDTVELDREFLTGAEKAATEGAERARAAGLDAAPLAVLSDGPEWETIAATAAERDAPVIVVGSRGLTGLKSVLLGSVSHGVLQHAARPVLVVPQADS